MSSAVWISISISASSFIFFPNNPYFFPKYLKIAFACVNLTSSSVISWIIRADIHVIQKWASYFSDRNHVFEYLLNSEVTCFFLLCDKNAEQKRRSKRDHCDTNSDQKSRCKNFYSSLSFDKLFTYVVWQIWKI